MSHIFFERLEQRRSTQSLFGGSGLFNDLSTYISYYGIKTPTDYYSNPKYRTISYPWSDPWQMPDSWTSPWSSPSSWLSPWTIQSPWSRWQSPWDISSLWLSLWYDPFNLFPWIPTLSPGPIIQDNSCYFTCYAVGPIGNEYSTFSPISQLEKVRKGLLAYFRDKGIISKENSIKIFSSTFKKA